ncbi:MAG: response regulator transcription factor [Vicinamibacteria bacterium]
MTTPSGAASTAAKTGKRVLVVDDEQYTCQFFEHLLEKEGFQVNTCFNGEEALERLAQQRYDVVLIDLRLPKMDGFELMRRVNARYAGTPMIMITAYGSIDTAVRAMKEGASDFVTKPFENLNTILATINAVLEGGGRGIAHRVAGAGGVPGGDLKQKVYAVFGETKLSKREKEIVLNLIHGMSNKEIGEKLEISERTVKNHLFNIYRKLGISNRNQLFNIFIEKTTPS